MSRIVQRSDGLMGSTALSSDGEVVNAGMIAAGFLGIFGRGNYRVIAANENFVVPANVTRLRVRVIAPGGGVSGSNNSNGACSGAGGGGYAHGVFDVTPGDIYAAVIGARGLGGNPGNNPGTAGGTTSFGALISATGGQPGVYVADGTAPGGEGGIGIGGDFQSKGGKGGDANTSSGGRAASGGAAGSQLGDGGNGATGDTAGGGGVGGNHASTYAAGSAFGPGGLLQDPKVGGPDIRGIFNEVENVLVENPISAPCRFPFDIFTGAASYSGSGGNVSARSAAGAGGPGLNSSVRSPSPGGHGGGGGAGSGTITLPGGEGGFGGGAGSGAGAAKPGAKGGRGLIIVEW